ncbi:kynureninase [Priestia taiwanensis]|uniref:Kynureninase n=1 Tax=Priestia taiwanensis TaxID=1347902 RepID=A0A917ALM9_9BACI|nr:kynureninase [Priestia taiwanensis]MBM7362261.1 kynureninase [Priestia taiwanensis]GGE60783.1 kynureninase [Priestia taiwanensis]
MTVKIDTSYEYALAMDKKDALATFREEFHLPSKSIYLDGNSLGLMSKRAEQSLFQLINSWKHLQIDGWTQGESPWFFLSEHLGDLMAPIVGANSDEVVVTGSTTVNIHQLISSFYKPHGNKTKIIATELDFPTDIYVLQSQLQLHGYNPDEHLVRIKADSQGLINEEDIISAMHDDIALIFLPTVLYRSGQLLDIERLTQEAHKRDIIIGFDACHSAGVIPHAFSKWGIDFALWCNYKYLNGGPGAVASLYVNRRHFGKVPGLTGWYSSTKEKQFDMEHTLTIEQTSRAYQLGTPHIFSLATLIGSLELFREATMEEVYKKSRNLTRYMMDLIQHELHDMGFSIHNPDDDARRGGHVSLKHAEAVRITKALKDHQITPDFRAPDIIRLAPVAFYTSFAEVWKTVQTLKSIMQNKSYEKYNSNRNVVA